MCAMAIDCMLWVLEQEQMKGSTVEAMADAVEGAAKMCYGVSRAYKVHWLAPIFIITNEFIWTEPVSCMI